MLNRKYLVTWDRKLIAVGYNYNTRKFLYFVATEDTGSTKACIPYFIITLTSLLMFLLDLMIFPLVVSDLF